MTPVIGGRSGRRAPAPGRRRGGRRVADDDLADVADLQRGLVGAVVVGDLPAHQAGVERRAPLVVGHRVGDVVEVHGLPRRLGRGALGERGGGRGHRRHHRQALDQLPAVHPAGLELVQQRLDRLFHDGGPFVTTGSELRRRCCRRRRQRTRGTAWRAEGRRASRRPTGTRRTSASAPRGGCRAAWSTPRPRGATRWPGWDSCGRARGLVTTRPPPGRSLARTSVTDGGAVSGWQSAAGVHPLRHRGLVLALALHHVHPAVAVEVGERQPERARRGLAVEGVEPGREMSLAVVDEQPIRPAQRADHEVRIAVGCRRRGTPPCCRLRRRWRPAATSRRSRRGSGPCRRS